MPIQPISIAGMLDTLAFRAAAQDAIRESLKVDGKLARWIRFHLPTTDGLYCLALRCDRYFLDISMRSMQQPAGGPEPVEDDCIEILFFCNTMRKYRLTMNIDDHLGESRSFSLMGLALEVTSEITAEWRAALDEMERNAPKTVRADGDDAQAASGDLHP